MHAKLLFAVVLTATINVPAWAGWFGPDNYEECILDSMKGVTSNAAAVAIAQACRAKFPLPPPPPPTAEELEKHAKSNEECVSTYIEKERNRLEMLRFAQEKYEQALQTSATMDANEAQRLRVEYEMDKTLAGPKIHWLCDGPKPVVSIRPRRAPSAPPPKKSGNWWD